MADVMVIPFHLIPVSYRIAARATLDQARVMYLGGRRAREAMYAKEWRWMQRRRELLREIADALGDENVKRVYGYHERATGLPGQELNDGTTETQAAAETPTHDADG